MKPYVTYSSNNYGQFIEHIWILHSKDKNFFLGQDVKFCRRVLCMEPKEVIDAIGCSDLDKKRTQEKLASFILKILNISIEELDKLEEWELCSQ